jgi:hypothetical protein
MPARAHTSGPKTLPRQIAGGDVDEAESLDIAARVLLDRSPVLGWAAARNGAYAAISAWIVERTRRQTAGRLSEHVVFNLGEAHLTGMVTACLPQIGGTLAEAGFPMDKAFGDLTKAQAVQLFLAGCVAYREAAVRKGEAPDFPFEAAFDDAIPFGPITDAEVPW